jgi:serine O-acetyltransferase
MIRKTILFIGQLLFIPHFFLFLFSKNKSVITEDIYARKTKREGFFNHFYYLSLELLINKYFRNLFYYRTNGVLAKILRIFYPQKESFTIDIHTKIGPGLQLAHPYSTILNADRIGSSVYVNHLVTVGEKNGNKPIIEDNVVLNAGCIVIGGITIGKNSIIGAGAVVVKNIPENSVVVGNPGRIILKSNH